MPNSTSNATNTSIDIGSRIARINDEMESLISTRPFEERNTWTNMAAVLLDGRMGMRWDRGVFTEVYENTDTLLQNHEQESIGAFLSYLFSSYQTFRQLKPSIETLWSGGLNGVVRTRTISLPSYTAILEGCYSNLARALFVLLSQKTGRDYLSQNKLKQMSEVYHANGFPQLGDIPNTSLRNAINHGGIIILNASGNKTCRIRYTYTDHGTRQCSEMTSSEMESTLFDVVDSMRGALLAILACLVKNGERKWIDCVDDEYEYLMYVGFSLGDANLWCLDASAVLNNPQANFTFETNQTDRTTLFVSAEQIFVEAYKLLPSFNRFTVAFSNPRLAANFLRVNRVDIESFIANGSFPGKLSLTAIEHGEWMWFEPSDESISLADAYFFRFPYYDDGKMSIFDIEDVSLEDRKRLRGRVFTYGKHSREETLSIATSAISWIKRLRNPPCPSMRVKHGDMEADCVYLDIYKDELDKDRSLLENNQNFICEVEYCPNKDFLLTSKNGFISYIYNNSEWINEDTLILWRDRNNLTIRNESKIGRNDPCPCGSGKKYKRCCGA